jgi:rhodanese-related sulfurtransferase
VPCAGKPANLPDFGADYISQNQPDAGNRLQQANDLVLLDVRFHPLLDERDLPDNLVQKLQGTLQDRPRCRRQLQLLQELTALFAE